MADNPFLDALKGQFLNSTPQAAFNYVFRPQLGSRNRNFTNFLGQQADSYYGGYLGALADNPTMMYTDYLKQQDPVAAFRRLAPQQRGENWGLFAPRVRQIG